MIENGSGEDVVKGDLDPHVMFMRRKAGTQVKGHGPFLQVLKGVKSWKSK